MYILYYYIYICYPECLTNFNLKILESCCEYFTFLLPSIEILLLHKVNLPSPRSNVPDWTSRSCLFYRTQKNSMKRNKSKAVRPFNTIEIWKVNKNYQSVKIVVRSVEVYIWLVEKGKNPVQKQDKNNFIKIFYIKMQTSFLQLEIPGSRSQRETVAY